MTLNVEDALRSFALGSPTISGIVGDKWMPHMATNRQARPFIAYHRFGIGHEHHMRGASGMLTGRIQLDLICDKYETAKALSEAVRNRLDGNAATVTTSSGTVRLQRLEIIDEREEYTPPFDASDTGIYRNVIDLSLSASEPIPTGN